MDSLVFYPYLVPDQWSHQTIFIKSILVGIDTKYIFSNQYKKWSINRFPPKISHNFAKSTAYCVFYMKMTNPISHRKKPWSAPFSWFGKTVNLVYFTPQSIYGFGPKSILSQFLLICNNFAKSDIFEGLWKNNSRVFPIF